MYHFDDAQNECIVEDYRTPTPWMNYLSNGTFHTMISQAGGGLAFYRSPEIWRINRYRFYNLPMDRSGFYTYLQFNGQTFCPTAEPYPEKPQPWRACHGMGYTRFEAKRAGLQASATYFVGQENCLIWHLELCATEDGLLKVFPYVELGMMEYLREVQWQCYCKHQLSVQPVGDVLVYHYHPDGQPRPTETPLVYFACDRPWAGYDCDRDEFVGNYSSEENPRAVREGHCFNSRLQGGDGCFAMEIPMELKAGQKIECNFYLGTAMTQKEINAAVARLRAPGCAEAALGGLKAQWKSYLSHFQCVLPDRDAQTMVNSWNPYQAERNFVFSRDISFYATGTARGIGFRDTAQDILSVIPFDVERAEQKLALLLGQQYQAGNVNHSFFPLEGYPPNANTCSDDALWPILTVYHLVMEEGRLDFLARHVPFFDGGEATVLEHLKRAAAFTGRHLGPHGLPLMLHGDWNDMLCRVCEKGVGESVWTGMQFAALMPLLTRLCMLAGDPADYLAEAAAQKERINAMAWDGEWYIRCITDEGVRIGSSAEPQAKIWLNTQSWAILSGIADADRARRAMDSVKERLDTKLGIKKLDPPLGPDYPSAAHPLTGYNPGCGENGSVFCHANTWAIIAECMLKRPENAWKYYHQLLPMVVQKRAGEARYHAEPYVYSSNIFGPDSDRFGLANVSWLTGTATWMYQAATRHILGIRPEWEGLRVDPCLPPEWDDVTVTRVFRGCTYHIRLKNGGKNVLIPHQPGRTEYEIVLEGEGSEH